MLKINKNVKKVPQRYKIWRILNFAIEKNTFCGYLISRFGYCKLFHGI